MSGPGGRQQEGSMRRSLLDLNVGSRVLTDAGMFTLVGVPEVIVRNRKRSIRLRLRDAFGKLHYFLDYEIKVKRCFA